MSEINSAIALSDLHLGNEQSYLHSKSAGYKKNKAALLKLLKKLRPHEDLILNGDTLELALAPHDEICIDVKEFFSFDYHIGHAGRLSERARRLEQAYQKGEKEAKKTIVETLDLVCDNLSQTLKLKWWHSFLIKHGLRFVVKRIPIRDNSKLFRNPIDEKLKESIVEYIKTYLVQRYIRGKRREYGIPSNNDIPTPFTFVFGHTHRPVKDNDPEKNKVMVLGKEYPLANTGGWLRTDGKGHGDNAGVLVIDESGVRWESLEGKLE